MSEPVRALKTPGGDLLAITQSGSGHMINNRDKINELLAYRSGDGGATWQGPTHPWQVSYNQHGFNPMVPRGSTPDRGIRHRADGGTVPAPARRRRRHATLR